ARDVQNLPQTGPDRARQASEITERKEDQIAQLEQMEETLQRLASEARQEQPDAARRLRAAADAIGRNQLPDRIRASRANVTPNAPPEYARRMEQEIQSDLEELERLAEEASRAISNPDSQGDESLDRARGLVRGLESMQERLRQGEQGQQGQQGQ